MTFLKSCVCSFLHSESGPSASEENSVARLACLSLDGSQPTLRHHKEMHTSMQGRTMCNAGFAAAGGAAVA
eukprot:4839044-Pleurochrysis_carterae.AAC.3